MLNLDLREAVLGASSLHLDAMIVLEGFRCDEALAVFKGTVLLADLLRNLNTRDVLFNRNILLASKGVSLRAVM